MSLTIGTPTMWAVLRLAYSHNDAAVIAVRTAGTVAVRADMQSAPPARNTLTVAGIDTVLYVLWSQGNRPADIELIGDDRLTRAGKWATRSGASAENLSDLWLRYAELGEGIARQHHTEQRAWITDHNRSDVVRQAWQHWYGRVPDRLCTP